MGRKSKRPVEIESSSQGSTEVTPRDGLPAFARFIDINGSKRGKKTVTRLFLDIPTNEDIADTLKLQKSMPELVTVGASMLNIRTTTTLAARCRNLGLPGDFVTDLVRLVINYLQGRGSPPASVGKFYGNFMKFVGFLAAQVQKPSALTDIEKEVWLLYLAELEGSKMKSAKNCFYQARAPFLAYEPTSQAGWLVTVPFRSSRRTKPSPEHTSELAEVRDYSDEVMYQFLSLFVYEFDRRIGYLKRYESISEADMPKDWLYPGRIAVRGKGNLRDTNQLVRQWLQDEGKGYEILIDHHLMHHKLGVIRKTKSAANTGGISTILQNLSQKKEAPLVTKFRLEMARRHGYGTVGAD